jgi:hypothetical protein
MSKYTPLINALESPTEERSFHSLAKALGFDPANAYNTIKWMRPDLLGPRSERLGHKQVGKTDIPDNVRADALSKVLSGRPVKEVAAETGVPAPTLYQMAQKARAKTDPKPKAVIKALKADEALVQLLLTSIKQASTNLGTTPERLCDLLKKHLTTT